jgi:hypothetical protein
LHAVLADSAIKGGPCLCQAKALQDIMMMGGPVSAAATVVAAWPTQQAVMPTSEHANYRRSLTLIACPVFLTR